MTSEFVTYEQAVKLKELGFDESCMFVHDTWGNTKNWTEDGEGEHRNSDKNASIYYSAPLKQQVFRWFRDEHQFDGWATPCYTSDGKFYSFIIENGKESEIDGSYDDFKTYEEAESACVDKLIEIIKKKL